MEGELTHSDRSTQTDELLTTEQAAELIELGTGQPPPTIRIGRRHYYLRSDLEQQGITPRDMRPKLVAI